MTKPQIFRPSTYNIIVELKNAPDKYMMVHGYTGAIDIANPNVIELLKPGNRVSRVNSLVSIKTFNTLVKRGYLTQKTAAEERQFCQRWANFMHSWRKRFGMRSFMFMVTYDCNFRCPYCYESTISEHGRQWTKKTFTKEMVDRAYEAMTEIEPDEQKRAKSITLYGGEPLLAQNREIVEYIVQKGLEQGYKFEAISNGYEIDHYLNLLDPEKIYSIQISVDGPKEIHDRRRYHYQDGGTFDKIFQNIGLALNKGIRIGLRANTDATNYQFIESLYDQFKSIGYTDNPNFVFSAALVVGDENIRPESQVISNPEHPATLLSKADFNAKMQQTKVPGQHQEMWIYRKLYTAIKHMRIFCSGKGQPTGLCTAATVGTACTNQSGEITLSGNTHTECSMDKLLHFQSNCTDCLNFRASHFSGDNDTGKSVFFCPDCTRWGTDGHLCGGMQRHFRNPLMNVVGNAQILYC